MEGVGAGDMEHAVAVAPDDQRRDREAGDGLLEHEGLRDELTEDSRVQDVVAGRRVKQMSITAAYCSGVSANSAYSPPSRWRRSISDSVALPTPAGASSQRLSTRSGCRNAKASYPTKAVP